MSALLKVIKQLRKDAGLTQAQAAAALGITQAAYSRKEAGEFSVSPADRKALATLFGMSLEQFDEKWRATKREMWDTGEMIPVINRGPAGLVYDHEEAHQNGAASEFIDRGDIRDRDVFALIITGESMMPTLRDGDYVVFKPVQKYREITIEPGTIVYVRMVDDAGHDAGCTIARYFVEGTLVSFQKDNPKFPRIIVPGERITQLATFVEMRRKKL